MSDHPLIRVGMIGAGAICRQRHLPGLAKIPGVEIAAVANRTVASATEIAKAFDIPRVCEHWSQIVDDPDIDAVLIGTWPYTHAPMAEAALDAAKHVFCQARMAPDLAQAQRMRQAHQRHPNLVAMVCPPPTRMPYEPYINHLIQTDQLGRLLSVELRSISDANLPRKPATWREMIQYSGKQAMMLGILAETLHAIVGPYRSLSAHAAVHEPIKQDADGQDVWIQIPQHITISGTLANGALATEHHFALATDASTSGSSLTIHGSKGTLQHRYDENTLWLAEPGKSLEPANPPGDMLRPWQVEQDFIDAVRKARQGQAWAVDPDFDIAMMYMRKVEAVHLSALTGRAVDPESLTRATAHGVTG